MPDNNPAATPATPNEIRESTCIHTKKIYDSCQAKDCVEDLRFYPTASAQEVLSACQMVRGGTAEPAPSIEAGVARAVELGGTGPVCALGTLYFSGEVREAFRKICPLSR